MSVRDLKDQASAERYYASRFSEGYMRDWPVGKLVRVAAVIAELGLPREGRFLDFGCGTGVFSGVLSTALPGWTGCGVDIVDSALEQARRRLPNLQFARIDELQGTYDLVFSHHVLEHVLDLDATLGLLARSCAPGGTILNILPCGNPGSLEHRVSSAIEGGIDLSRGGRFFFEDEGHLRRLSSEELTGGLERHGLVRAGAYFANHHIGALKWMSEQTPEWITDTLDPSRTATPQAGAFIAETRRDALAWRSRRRPRSKLIPGFEWRLEKPTLSWMEWAVLVALNPSTVGSRAADREIDVAEQREWRERRTDPQGSEMFVVVKRPAAAAIVR